MDIFPTLKARRCGLMQKKDKRQFRMIVPTGMIRCGLMQKKGVTCPLLRPSFYIILLFLNSSPFFQVNVIYGTFQCKIWHSLALTMAVCVFCQKVQYVVQNLHLKHKRRESISTLRLYTSRRSNAQRLGRKCEGHGGRNVCCNEDADAT